MYWTHLSIRVAYLSQSRAEKNTDDIQYAGVLEVVPCRALLSRKDTKHVLCLSIDSHLQWATPVVMLPVLSRIASVREWFYHMHFHSSREQHAYMPILSR